MFTGAVAEISSGGAAAVNIDQLGGNALTSYLPVQTNSGTSFTDNAVVSGANAWTPLPSHPIVNAVSIQANKSNTSGSSMRFAIGNTGTPSTTGFELQPGQGNGLNASATLTNTNQIYISSVNATDGVCIAGS